MQKHWFHLSCIVSISLRHHQCQIKINDRFSVWSTTKRFETNQNFFIFFFHPLTNLKSLRSFPKGCVFKTLHNDKLHSGRFQGVYDIDPLWRSWESLKYKVFYGCGNETVSQRITSRLFVCLFVCLFCFVCLFVYLISFSFFRCQIFSFFWFPSFSF